MKFVGFVGVVREYIGWGFCLGFPSSDDTCIETFGARE